MIGLNRGIQAPILPHHRFTSGNCRLSFAVALMVATKPKKIVSARIEEFYDDNATFANPNPKLGIM